MVEINVVLKASSENLRSRACHREDFFSQKASTTTIPAQFIKKFKCKVIPVYVERNNNDDFELTFESPINFTDKDTINSITEDLNKLLEKMILRNPEQWIWTHGRWK